MSAAEPLNDAQRVVVGLALFERMCGAAFPLIGADLQRCASAARARIGFVQFRVLTVARQAADAGMVSGAAVLDALVSRSMSGDTWRHVMDRSPLFWYATYCAGLAELGEVMRGGVASGVLTLRGVPLRTPIQIGDLSYWLNADLRAKADVWGILPACGEWDAAHTAWPDAFLSPPGALLEQDAEDWAVSAGLIQPGHLRSVLGLAEPAAHTCADVVPFELVRSDSKSNECRLETWCDLVKFRLAHDGAKWTQEQADILRTEEMKRKAKPGAKGIRLALATELGYKSQQRIGQVLKDYPAPLASAVGAGQGANAGGGSPATLNRVIDAWIDKGAAR